MTLPNTVNLLVSANNQIVNNLPPGDSRLMAPGIKVSADYSGEIGRSNQTVHQVSLEARIAF